MNIFEVIPASGFGLGIGLVLASKWDKPNIVLNRIGPTHKIIHVGLYGTVGMYLMSVAFSGAVLGTGTLWHWAGLYGPTGYFAGLALGLLFIRLCRGKTKSGAP